MNAIFNNCNSNSNCQDKVNFSDTLITVIQNLKQYLLMRFFHTISLIEKHCPTVTSNIPLIRKCHSCGKFENTRTEKNKFYLSKYRTLAGYFENLSIPYECENCSERTEKDLLNLHKLYLPNDLKCENCQVDDIQPGDHITTCTICFFNLNLHDYCAECGVCKQFFDYEGYEFNKVHARGYPVCDNCQVKYLKQA